MEKLLEVALGDLSRLSEGVLAVDLEVESLEQLRAEVVGRNERVRLVGVAAKGREAVVDLQGRGC